MGEHCYREVVGLEQTLLGDFRDPENLLQGDLQGPRRRGPPDGLKVSRAQGTSYPPPQGSLRFKPQVCYSLTMTLGRSPPSQTPVLSPLESS